ncbi:MAG: DUF3325 family protein [Alphaproteobacteria bacterium]
MPLSFTLAYAGLAALALAMERHQRQVWRRPLAVHWRRLLRPLGWLAIAVAFAAAVAAEGWSLGPVAFTGLLALAGLALVFLLAFAPRLAAAFAIVAPAGAAALVLA